MGWSALNLANPALSAAGLDQQLTSFSVSPFTPGVGEGGGNHTWLSFPNAVKAVIKQLKTQPAGAVFALAISAANYVDLAAQLAVLDAALPLKQLKQWRRHALSLVALETDKFKLVDNAVQSLGGALNAVPTVRAQMEKALAVQGLADVAALKAANPLAELNTFVANKAAFDAVTNTALPALIGGAGWRFYADANITDELQTGHPGDEYTLTAMLVFVGSPSDLAYLTQLMP